MSNGYDSWPDLEYGQVVSSGAQFAEDAEIAVAVDYIVRDFYGIRERMSADGSVSFSRIPPPVPEPSRAPKLRPVLFGASVSLALAVAVWVVLWR